MTRTIVSGFNSSRRRHSFLVNLAKEEGELISNSQKRILTELIMFNIDDESDREYRLDELGDLTEKEAELAIFQFLTASWR